MLRLIALTDLTDGQEAPESYHSARASPNNAPHPAVPFTYEFLAHVSTRWVEAVSLDLYAPRRREWQRAPGLLRAGQAVMEKEGIIAAPSRLQSYSSRAQKRCLRRADASSPVELKSPMDHGGGSMPADYVADAWGKS